MSAIRFERFERRGLLGRRFYFRIVAEGNNEILAPSQPYKHAESREHAIRLIKGGAASAPVVAGKRA